MVRSRSILSLILAIVAVFLVSCGGPTAAKLPQTYTPVQIEQIQEYLPDLVSLRNRMSEVPILIQRRDWIGVRNFIHGPLGELRLKMTYITRNLLPSQQKAARDVTRQLFDDLVKVEQAIEENNTQGAVRSYQATLADINKFLELVPQEAQSAAEE
ncbi:photosystem II protein PsbQ [Aliterella atlantica]|uniref:Photosystem II protein PsbQ n=1 Tax=Aliterella atlantica CENA595 TaxID=1618023 RepID=A0A0D8ZQW6_9CYAN|nr:photosystem II protein PsbQ [Aliterella atlantica]KJH70727.1 photosystem II protein PsbQ [Aliterella atlantica CENA595]